MIGRDVHSKRMAKFGALVIGLLLPLSGFAQPAPGIQVPVNDAINIFWNQTLTQKEVQFDITGWVQKQLIQQITNQLVNWINSGFNGSPVFVQNPFQELADIARLEIDSFLDETTGQLTGLNEAFQSNVRRSLASYFSDNFRNKTQSSLPGSISDPADYNKFVSGNFNQGGWDAWFAVTQNPNNNYYGSFLKGESEISQRIVERQVAEQTVWDWGDGFRSITDELGNIITPGNLIEEQLNHVLGSSVRQIELADEFNEIIGALTAQLTNQLFTSGGGLFGLSRPSTDGSGISFTERISTEEIDTSSSSINIDSISIGQSGSTGANIGLNQSFIASQSGTYQNRVAKNAVDGQLSRRGLNTTSITDSIVHPWWQIDFRGTRSVEFVNIFKRGNAGASASVGAFRVFLSEEPFSDDFDPTAPPPNSGTFWASETLIYGENESVVEINASGRYLRIQRVEDARARLQLDEVEIFENVPPTIDLNGANPMTLNVGETYAEPGAEVSDPTDHDPVLTIDSSDVNTNIEGSYEVIYTAKDSGNATRTVTRIVNVVE